MTSGNEEANTAARSGLAWPTGANQRPGATWDKTVDPGGGICPRRGAARRSVLGARGQSVSTLRIGERFTRLGRRLAMRKPQPLFLVGGPAYSGTTLLAHLLNQEGAVCLDEPAFHHPDPEKSRRGLPYLRERFPDRTFPDMPKAMLSYDAAVDLIASCQRALAPMRLGIKTCNKTFVEYAKVFYRRRLPVVAIIRDVRDALASPLPENVGGEEGLYKRYRYVWKYRRYYDLCIRYEDLVRDPERMLRKISRVVRYEFDVKATWESDHVQRPMLKTHRHARLLAGRISTDRVGVWHRSGLSCSAASHHTARMMGYR